MERKGNWTGTYSGLKFYPLDPRPEDINLIDIAHALSNICRFNGHTIKFYSVADHCLNVYHFLCNQGCVFGICLLGLLHDAAEAYICDVPRPLKEHLPGYKEIEEKIMAAVYQRFGIDPPTPEEEEIIKQADDHILSLEARELMLHTEDWSLPDADKSYVLKINTSLTALRFKLIAEYLIEKYAELRTVSHKTVLI